MLQGICGSSTNPRPSQGSWCDELVGFFVFICFSGGEALNMAMFFIMYELFDECDKMPVDINPPEGYVLIVTIAIFLVRKRVSLPHLCIRAARSPLPLCMYASQRYAGGPMVKAQMPESSNAVRIVHLARDYWFEHCMGCKFARQASAPQFSCAMPLPPLLHVHLYLYVGELGSLPRSKPYRVRS